MTDDKPQYQRVTQKWICGYASEGRACANGPDKKGCCGGGYQCEPLQKEGRWYCSRGKAFGGNCEQGPNPDGTCCNKIPPCQPVLNLRYRRGNIVKLTMSLILIAIVFVLGHHWLRNTILPGTLSSEHGNLGDCNQCHTSLNKDTPLAFLFHQNAGQLDSQKCLECHKLGPQPLSPHDLPENALKSSDALKTPDAATFLQKLSKKVTLKDKILHQECFSCHKEHRGQAFDITKVSEQTCQRCHAKTFHSFDKGHPEFTNFPYAETMAFKFDHREHEQKHYLEDASKDKAPKNCQSCHFIEEKTKEMKVKPYSETCASCHSDDVLGTTRTSGKGFPVLAVFTLDVKKLNDAGLSVGDWPVDADNEMTSFERTILEADPEVKKAMDSLKQDDIGLDDLHKAKPEQLQAAQTIALKFKRFIYDLSNNGDAALSKRLDKSGVNANLIKIDLPAEESVHTIEHLWFPDLKAEMDSLDKNQKLTAAKDLKKDPNLHSRETEYKSTGEDWAEQGGWYWTEYTLFYRPIGHADQNIRTWIETSYNNPGKFAGLDLMKKQLTDDEGPGRCGKCHNFELKSTDNTEPQWQALAHVSQTHFFNKFNHLPHVTLLKSDCQQCHRFGTDDKPNFVGMQKKDCVTCHNAKQSSQSCMQCHSYHVQK